MKITTVYQILMAILVLFAGKLYPQDDEVMYEVSVKKYLMGTTVETTASSSDINYCKEALVAAYSEIERVENLLSCEKGSSEISEINNAAGLYPVKVSYETLSMLQRSNAYSKKYQGIFDITIGPLTNLWGFSSDREVVLPDEKTIKGLLKLVNYDNIIINEKDTSVFLPQKGMSIDLGGVAKGYAVDRASAVLKKMGITNFIIKAGGDIYVSGTKEKDTLWKVGIKDPRHSNNIIAKFDLKDYAVSTSGDYERFKIIDGKRYHHILDPGTGYPGMLSESATILAPTSEEADATSTYIFLKGWERTLSDTKINFPILIVSSDGSIHYNEIFARKYNLEITN